MQHAWVNAGRRRRPCRRLRRKTRAASSPGAAGSEFFSHRDPLYHITEDFRQTFDEIGRRHAAALAGESAAGFTRTEQAAQPPQWAEQQTGPVRDAQKPNPTNAKDLYQMRWSDNQDMVRRFSETAFQRGTLAGAVMAGTGKMMLVSCLKRTVGSPSQVQGGSSAACSRAARSSASSPDTGRTAWCSTAALRTARSAWWSIRSRTHGRWWNHGRPRGGKSG